MFDKIKKRFDSALQKLDWPWRVIIAAAITSLAVVLVVILVIIKINNKVTTESLLNRADLLSAWMGDKNSEVLGTRRPELADIGFVSGQPLVKKAMLFDANGKVVAPLSMHGDGFADKTLFKELISSRAIKVFLGKSRSLEVFRPVIDSSGKITGMAYLELARIGGQRWGYISAISVFIILVFSSFVWWLLRETHNSIQSVTDKRGTKRFNYLRQALEKMVNQKTKGLTELFESKWRALIHALPKPVIILDKLFRLVEMNEIAMNRFKGNFKVVEGTHILDMLKGDNPNNYLVKVLDDLEKGDDGVVSIKAGDDNISIISSHSGKTIFKYTIIYSDLREGL